MGTTLLVRGDSVAHWIRASVGADRVAIGRFRDEPEMFEIFGVSGVPLLSPGARIPVVDSRLLSTARTGRTELWRADAGDDTSRTGLEPLLQASGFRASCALPLMSSDGSIGAVILSARDRGWPLLAAARQAAALSALAVPALQTEWPRRAPRVVVCCEDPIAALGVAALAETRLGLDATVCPTAAALSEHVGDALVCDEVIAGWLLSEARERRSPVVVLAQADTAEARRLARALGAAGYVARAGGLAALEAALRRALSGEPVLAASNGGPGPTITRREREILAGFAAGRRTKEVARGLGITEATVKTHARRISKKLGTTTRGQAIYEARRRGLLR